MSRLAVALSGGVDSAVAAARLLDAGHDVTAVHLALQDSPQQAAEDARAVAEALGVPFLLWDLSGAFQREVIGYFVDEYAAGRTPNPCLRCNQTIKFGALLDRAVALGFDGLATGHYARRVDVDGAAELHRGVDAQKDQSYVLAVLTQARLRRVWFPLGASTKAEVRAEAAARGLPIAAKAESMDLCFIPDGDTAGWLARRLGPAPGLIVDEAGEALGAHDGTYLFTIGQRKGLNLKRPAPDGQPRFVTGLDAAGGRVVVGPREGLAVDKLVAGPAIWTAGVAASEPIAARVQLRAHGGEQDGVVAPLPDGSVEIELRSPALGVATGQTAVAYDGTRVVVAATINQTWRATRQSQM